MTQRLHRVVVEESELTVFVLRPAGDYGRTIELTDAELEEYGTALRRFRSIQELVAKRYEDAEPHPEEANWVITPAEYMNLEREYGGPRT